MTPQEAKKLVKTCGLNIEGKKYAECENVILSALEKQIPKKPTPHKVDVERIKIGNVNWGRNTTIYYCPNCKDFISRNYTYCHKCGQALDWSDTE